MGERTNNEMENLSLQTKNRFSRDLLQRFMVSNSNSRDPRGSDPDEEVELNLGLSLGGRFGVDKSNSSLVRSSSIAAILPVVKDDDVLGTRQRETGPGGAYSSLIRTASLPLESEEWRKRKELQSLRRLAAKRRRSEKQRNLTKVEKEESLTPVNRVGSLGSGKWDFGVATTTPTSDGGAGKLTPPSLPVPAESQTSSKSELTRHLQGSNNEGEISPASVKSAEERSNQDGSSSSRSKMADTAIRPISRPKPEIPSNNKGKAIGMNTFDMPCVFTQGDSPSGRRIEGILYKYGKGEEVKIMCVCHGSFLSPAEFVKHAGGTDVVHPLKHIVVNPNSSSYL